MTNVSENVHLQNISSHSSSLAEILHSKQNAYSAREESSWEKLKKEVEGKDSERMAEAAKWTVIIRQWDEEEERKKAEAKARAEEAKRKKAEAERLKREEEEREKAEEERKKAEREEVKRKNEEEEKALFARQDIEAFIDLGLSVKWATCNIGASMPLEQGDFYAWGEVEPKREYSLNTYHFYDKIHKLNTKYQNKHKVLVKKHVFRKDEYLTIGDDKTILDECDDVANNKLQGRWRMPTETEFRELINECKWTWTEINKVKGYKVQSKKQGFTDKCIFLPVCGIFDCEIHQKYGIRGCYWSSTRSEFSGNAKNLTITMNRITLNNINRAIGTSIRPVKE